MLRHPLIAIALIVATFGQALAIPGQTMGQLAQWGKSNAAFTGFKREYDDSFGRYKYVANVVAEHFHAKFTSMPIDNVVQHEQLAFSNMPPNWDLTRNWKFNARVLGDVYGAAVAADVMQPRDGYTVRHVAVRLGRLYAYVAVEHTLRVYRRTFYRQVVMNAKSCGNVDCGSN